MCSWRSGTLLANTGRVRGVALAFVLLALQLCASGCQPRTAGDDAPEHERSEALTVAVYPGSQHVGEGRVYGEGGGHITWAAYATADPPAVVVAYYRAALSREDADSTYRFEPADHGGGIWRHIVDGEVTAVVNVLPADEPGPHRELPDRLLRSAKTVVIVSRR
jgi:hypothetical protein